MLALDATHPIRLECRALGAPIYAQIQVSDTSVGYLDTAIVADQLRFRFDAAYDNNAPVQLAPECQILLDRVTADASMAIGDLYRPSVCFHPCAHRCNRDRHTNNS